MKQKLIYLSILLIGLFSSCKNGIEFENAIYITGTESSDTRQLVVDGVPSEVAFSVTLADLIDETIGVEIEIDNSLIEVYNTKNKKNYKAMPAGSFSLSASALTIEAGNLRSDPAKIVITDDSGFEEGSNYLIPVKIKKINGDIRLLEASSVVYFAVLKTIVTKACNLRGNFFFRADFAKFGDASLTALSGVTMETRFYCTATMASNPWISSIMGLEENWLIRMGDAGNIPNNAIQVAGGGSAATAPNPIPLGEWHHVAAVFDNGIVRLYVDGDLVAQSPRPSATIDLTGVYADPCFSIGISANATVRRWNGYLSETRVWKKALSRAEISNNMCYVDPTTPGLVAYWRFDGSTTNENVVITSGTNAGTYPRTVILDHTGNGYNAVPYNTTNSSNPPVPMTTLMDANNWVDNVKCP
jgi:Domain of unknown function (DUF1735).